MTFVHATFVLATFVHIRNISAVTDPILMKLYHKAVNKWNWTETNFCLSLYWYLFKLVFEKIHTWSLPLSDDLPTHVKKSNNPADHVFQYFNQIGNINIVSRDSIHYTATNIQPTQTYLVTTHVQVGISETKHIWPKGLLSSGRDNHGEPGNLKVSQEILIVNPAHLSWKCDTPKRTQTS